MLVIRVVCLAWAIVASLVACSPVQAAERTLTLASTTSTEQSGLFGHILPMFLSQTGISVRVVAVGTGQALTLGARGDCDAVLVHDRAGEDDLVAKGHGVDRRDVMYNDFVLLGPSADPAGIRGRRSATAALQAIAKPTHNLRQFLKDELPKRPGIYDELAYVAARIAREE